MNLHRFWQKALTFILPIVICLTGFTACNNNEDDEQQTELSPRQIVEQVFMLTKKKEYNEVAGYCRSFSPYSVELYFHDTGTSFETAWTERYSETLYNMFTEYVTYTELSEKLDIESRTGTVSGTFTAIDLEKFNEKTDSKINSEMKNDFDAQMDYIDSVIGDSSLKSKPFKLDIEFRYTNGEWVIAEKSFLILLTLGYYSE